MFTHESRNRLLVFLAQFAMLAVAASSFSVLLHADRYFTADGAMIARATTVAFNIGIFILTLFVLNRYKSDKGSYFRQHVGSLLFFQIVMLFLLPQFIFPNLIGAPWWLQNPFFSTFLVIVMPWLGPFMLIGAGGFLFWYGIFYLILLTVLVYFFGRRVYCGWICQRALLSETLGDFWRQKTPRGRLSRIFEFVPYFIMLAVFFAGITAILHIYFNFGYDTLISASASKLNTGMAAFTNLYNSIFYIAIYQIITLALYPLWGGRIFCRFFCPVGNFFGIVQRFGRYRVQGKGQCINCGECTINCAMGIDVEKAVTEGDLAVRDVQCVGCGICEYNCPVNNLELTYKKCPKRK